MDKERLGTAGQRDSHSGKEDRILGTGDYLSLFIKFWIQFFLKKYNTINEMEMDKERLGTAGQRDRRSGKEDRIFGTGHNKPPYFIFIYLILNSIL